MVGLISGLSSKMVAVELAQRTVLLQGTAKEVDPSSVELYRSSMGMLGRVLLISMLVAGTSCVWAVRSRTDP